MALFASRKTVSASNLAMVHGLLHGKAVNVEGIDYLIRIEAPPEASSFFGQGSQHVAVFASLRTLDDPEPRWVVFKFNHIISEPRELWKVATVKDVTSVLNQDQPQQTAMSDSEDDDEEVDDDSDEEEEEEEEEEDSEDEEDDDSEEEMVMPMSVRYMATLMDRCVKLEKFCVGFEEFNGYHRRVVVNQPFIVKVGDVDVWMESYIPNFRKFWGCSSSANQRLVTSASVILSQLQYYIFQHSGKRHTIVDLQGRMTDEHYILCDIEFSDTLSSYSDLINIYLVSSEFRDCARDGLISVQPQSQVTSAWYSPLASSKGPIVGSTIPSTHEL